MKFLPSLKLVLFIGTLEIMLCLYELAYAIDCESAHADCSYFLLAIYANMPISLWVSTAAMVAFDHIHLPATEGTQLAASALLFLVFGTLWWSVLITFIWSAWKKWASRLSRA